MSLIEECLLEERQQADECEHGGECVEVDQGFCQEAECGTLGSFEPTECRTESDGNGGEEDGEGQEPYDRVGGLHGEADAEQGTEEAGGHVDGHCELDENLVEHIPPRCFR